MRVFQYRVPCSESASKKPCDRPRRDPVPKRLSNLLRAFCLLHARYRFSHSAVDVLAEVAWLVVDGWCRDMDDFPVATTGDVDMAPACRGRRGGIRLAGVAAGERCRHVEVASAAGHVASERE